MIEYVIDHWQQKDHGVWEVRGGKQHFSYSKLMCWVAVDRGLRLAEKRSFPADRQRWLNARDAMYLDIIKKGWNSSAKAFTQSYHSDTLDAANLIMPLVFFVSPTDPRMLSTLDQIRQSPRDGGLASNSLVYRYNTQTQVDGMQGQEGTFNICTFWLVEAMTRAGRFEPALLQEARLIFERILGSFFSRSDCSGRFMVCVFPSHQI